MRSIEYTDDRVMIRIIGEERFKVRSIEYADDRVMIRNIGEEPIDSDYPTSFYSGGTIRGKIPYDEFIKTFHMVIDE